MFGSGTRKNNNGSNQGRETSSPSGLPYTPTHADPSVITAGLNGWSPGSMKPEFSTAFTSIIGGAGGLGRKPSAARRSLIGGA